MASDKKGSTGWFGDMVSTISDFGKHTTDMASNLYTHMGKLGNPTLLTHAGAEALWREHFWAPPDEKLLFYFYCNLLTSVGPVPGTLVVTTASIGFLSDAEFEYNPLGRPTEIAKSHFVATIPLHKITGVAPEANPSDDNEKYIRSLSPRVSHYYSPIQEGDVNAPWRSPIDLLAIQGQIRRTTAHINSRYVDCGDDFGGGLSEKVSPFIARHGPNGVRRVEVEWVDSDGRPTSHCYVLHDSPLEGYPIAGTHERCVEQCTAMAEALVYNLDERLGSLDKLSGVKLFMPDEWPHGRQERSMVCTEHLESLTMLFRAQECDEIVPVAAPKKQPSAKGKQKVDEDDAGGAGSGWGTETPVHRHGSMSDGGGSDEDEDMCVM
ncbi:unnamed protein product [Closterium sp. NIES-64]|nr:unnamed protein product [Closterium sp. NIES-64]